MLVAFRDFYRRLTKMIPPDDFSPALLARSMNKSIAYGIINQPYFVLNHKFFIKAKLLILNRLY